MSARISQEAKEAAARCAAGEAKAKVSRETGVSRSTIDRHLKASGAMPQRVRMPLKVRAQLEGEADDVPHAT